MPSFMVSKKRFNYVTTFSTIEKKKAIFILIFFVDAFSIERFFSCFGRGKEKRKKETR